MQASKWAYRFAVAVFFVVFVLAAWNIAQVQSQCMERRTNAQLSNQRAHVLRQFMSSEGSAKFAALIPNERVPQCSILPF